MGRSKFSMTAEVDQLKVKRLQAFFGGGAARLFGNDLRQILDETSAEIEVKAYSRAPVGDTLVLSSSIQRYVDPRPIPTFAKVTANAETSSGFRYGWALQNSKAVVFRYRSGPRAMRLTLRWFTGAMGGAKKKLEQRLSGLARRAESRWRAA